MDQSIKIGGEEIPIGWMEYEITDRQLRRKYGQVVGGGESDTIDVIDKLIKKNMKKLSKVAKTDFKEVDEMCEYFLLNDQLHDLTNNLWIDYNNVQYKTTEIATLEEIENGCRNFIKNFEKFTLLVLEIYDSGAIDQKNRI